MSSFFNLHTWDGEWSGDDTKRRSFPDRSGNLFSLAFAHSRKKPRVITKVDDKNAMRWSLFALN